ncbi:hypothetical protein [Flavobacterium sp. J27]|nr:hypothetical protein [Flavobacterium sp. J27]
MKKTSFLLIVALLLLLASCTADEINTNNNVQTDEVDVDPSKVKPPTGG